MEKRVTVLRFFGFYKIFTELYTFLYYITTNKKYL